MEERAGAPGIGTDYRKRCVACALQDVVAAIAALRRPSEEMIQVEQRSALFARKHPEC
jgi:hypothetical protein